MYITIMKNNSRIFYVNSYKLSLLKRVYNTHQSFEFTHINISLNSYHCIKARKDVEENPNIDNDFHIKTVNMLKVYNPITINVESLSKQTKLPLYNSRIRITSAEDIKSLVECLFVEHGLFQRRSKRIPYYLSHITNNYKKLSISVPIMDLKNVAKYSLNTKSNLELKSLSFVFDFFFKF